MRKQNTGKVALSARTGVREVEFAWVRHGIGEELLDAFKWHAWMHYEHVLRDGEQRNGGKAVDWIEGHVLDDLRTDDL